MGAHRQAAQALAAVLSAAAGPTVPVLPLPIPDTPTAGAFIMCGMPQMPPGIEQEWPATGRLLVAVDVLLVAAGTDTAHAWQLLDLVDAAKDAVTAAGMIDEGNVADTWQPEGFTQAVPAQTLTVTVPITREC